MTGPVTRASNPVIRGFAPDPTIVRTGDDYYLATSTFEYFPGVRLHHSRDLVHWTVVGHALDTANGFDLAGVPDSGGVWAPSLTWSGGQFWLAYSVIRSMDGENKDLDNYLVTAPSITGPWSRPIALGSRGIDFSFFHDDDGSHWIVGVQWDHRPEHPTFGGIVLEEYLADEERVSGAPVMLYQQRALVEGPNLYHLNGWYYLLLAEGGTGWNHGITSARSRTLAGPYERDAEPALLTRRDLVGDTLQKAGHGELVQLPSGEWAMVHLASRPVIYGGGRYSTLGRETCIQRVSFDESGWLRLDAGGWHGETEVEIPLAATPTLPLESRDDFTGDDLDRARWATLRTDLDDGILDLRARPGWLRLAGGASTTSVFAQSMIVQRVTEPNADVEALIDAAPTTSRQAAGLILWYDRHAWIWLQVAHDAEIGRHVRVDWRDGQRTQRSAAVAVAEGPVKLEGFLRGPYATFAATASDGTRHEFADPFPAWILSDDHGGALRFTGMFVGVRAEDLDGTGWHADFDYVDARFRGDADDDVRARAFPA